VSAFVDQRFQEVWLEVRWLRGQVQELRKLVSALEERLRMVSATQDANGWRLAGALAEVVAAKRPPERERARRSRAAAQSPASRAMGGGA
jgi:hypothetical protein